MSWAQVWRWRAALAYTVGAWTVFGYILYRSSAYLEKTEEDAELAGNPPGTIISEDGLREITTYRTPGSRFTFVSTWRYKPNFVPYTTRFQNYVQSLLDDSGGKEK